MKTSLTLPRFCCVAAPLAENLILHQDHWRWWFGDGGLIIVSPLERSNDRNSKPTLPDSSRSRRTARL
jgi:hypothetical protein